MERKLFRSSDRILGGVCAGIAAYFGLDPTLIRIAYLLLTFFTTFSGVVVYLILWIIIPPGY